MQCLVQMLIDNYSFHFICMDNSFNNFIARMYVLDPDVCVVLESSLYCLKRFNLVPYLTY